MRPVSVSHAAEACFQSPDYVLGTDTPQRASDVLEALAGARLADLPTPLLVAINCEHASLTSLVHDGDEVAFFPPVSGG